MGGSPTIATYLLPPLLHAFQANYPGVEMRLTSAPSRVIARLLAEREIDIALVETPVEDPRLRSAVWIEDELVVIAAPSHLLVSRGTVPPSALVHELLVTREPGSGTYNTVMGALRAHGVVPQRRLEVDTAEAIIQLVAAGLGFAIVSRYAAADALALGRVAVVDVTGVRIRRPLMRLSLVTGGESAAARAFSGFLDEEVEQRVAPDQLRRSQKRPAKS